MRLKKLHLLGYKSFAEKTLLTFEPGITAIVGPNGCGKSNIADAFRWVLGEQSAKSMRGTKMSDVIFAGTSGRPPLHFAEVAITLTDIQGALPIDYEEVTVMRRLHRNGDSEYFLNGHPVRLKDLHLLFLDSGIGKDSFSIFEQGKIDQVIHYSPIERRYIFEEAAGILRFLQRKRETLRKLEQTDSNIARIKDIHREVEQQVTVLREQAAKALEFKDLKGQLETLEKELLVGKLRQMHQKKSEAAQQEAEMLQILAELSVKTSALEQQTSSVKIEIESQEQALKSKSEELFQVRSEKAFKIREKSFAQEQLASVHNKEKRCQQELEALLKQREQRELELQQHKKQLHSAETDASNLGSVLQAQKDCVEGLELELTKLHQVQKQAQQLLLEAHQKESQIDSELKQSHVRLENCCEKQKQLQKSKERLLQWEKELQQHYQEKEKLVEEGNAAIDHQREILQALESKIQELMVSMHVLQSERDALVKKINEYQARLKTLLRLRTDFEGFSLASKRLLQASSNPQSPLYGKIKGLYEFIAVEPAAQEAVAAVLARYSQTLVIQSKADADLVIAFAKQENLTDFSLVVLEFLPIIKYTSHTNLPSLLAQAAEAPVATHFLGDVLMAEKIEEAEVLFKTQQGREMWCRGGPFVDRRGVFFFGKQNESNVFMREAEIKTLEVELQQLESQNLKVQELLTELQQKRSLMHSEMVELDKNIRRKEMQQVEANFAFQRLGVDKEKQKKEFANVHAELVALSPMIEKYHFAIEDLKRQHAEAILKTQQAKDQLATYEADLQQKSRVLNEQKKLLQNANSSCNGIMEIVRRSQQAIQLIELKENESVRLEKRLSEELHYVRESQIELATKSQEYDLVLKFIEERLEKETKICSKMEEAIHQQKAYLAEQEKNRVTLIQNSKKQEQEQHQVAVLIAQLQAACQGLEAELQERYALTTLEAQTLFLSSDKSLDILEKKLREMRRKLEANSHVNMTAIEECAKHQTRYEFLNEQIKDLEQSKAELLQMISELEKESRKLFKETFVQICHNFKKNFAILFNGGEADLQFTEADLLEAGIEIIAKPPGKQMRSISLLSGGEKCLTAIALLFAIFEVKAGPFCILDEIDAPLDDSNVERFSNIVKQYIDRCQFIIITHNKQTMAIADRLFGISMEEKGISKLLQMEFSAVG